MGNFSHRTTLCLTIFLLFILLGGVLYADTSSDIKALSPGCWYEITNENFTDVYCDTAYGNCWADETEPDAEPNNGGSGPYSYSGGVYDSICNRIIIWGGGHWDWGGNEVYAYDFDTYKWSRIWGPSSYSKIVACGGDRDCDNYYAPNEPESRHTYKHLAYDPIGNRMFSSTARAPYGPGGLSGASSADFFYFDTLTWTGNGDLANNPDGSLNITVCDTETGDFWVVGVSTTGSAQDLYQYEPDTDAWTKRYDDIGLGARGNTPIPFSGAFDPINKIFLVQGNGQYRSIYVGNPVSPSITPSYSGDSTLVDMTDNPGADIVYDPISGLFIGYANGAADTTEIYIMSPTEHEWIKVEASENNTVIPASNWTLYGRFQMVFNNDIPVLHMTYKTTSPLKYRQYVYRLDYSSFGGDYDQLGGLGNLTVKTNVDAIEFRWPVYGDRNYDAVCTVQYKKTTEEGYSEAQNLFRFRSPVDTGASFNEFNGNIMFLEAGTTYDLILTVTDPDGGGKTYTGQATTTSWPVRPTDGDIWHVADDGSGTECSENYPCSLTYAIESAAGPGDIVKLMAGVYTGTTIFNKAGTEGNYIVYEEYGDGDANLEYARVTADYNWFSGLKFDADMKCGPFRSIGADYGVIEGCTITGGKLCGACGGAEECESTAYLGMVFDGSSDNWFIYGNTINGDRTISELVTTSDGDADTIYIGELIGYPDDYWGLNSVTAASRPSNPLSGAAMITEPGHSDLGKWRRIISFDGSTGKCELETGFSADILSGVAVAVWLNAAFSPEGIELNHSDNHVIAYNTITGVGDGISYPGTNVSIFGNDVYANHDDGIECDYAEPNLRVYENKLTNNKNNLSLQDTDNGSPWWIVRNQLIMGMDSGAIKIRSTSPQILYNNTFIQWNDFIPVQSQNARAFIMKNNIIILYNGGQFFDFRQFKNKYYTEIDYGGYYHAGTDPTPWTYISSSETMAEWTNDSDHDGNSILVDELSIEFKDLQVFEYLTPPVKGLAARYTVELKEGSLFKDAGVEIDNITDGYSGDVPDLGWVEYIQTDDGDGNDDDGTGDGDGNDDDGTGDGDGNDDDGSDDGDGDGNDDDGTDITGSSVSGGGGGCFLDQIMK